MGFTRHYVVSITYESGPNLRISPDACHQVLICKALPLSDTAELMLNCLIRKGIFHLNKIIDVKEILGALHKIYIYIKKVEATITAF